MTTTKRLVASLFALVLLLVLAPIPVEAQLGGCAPWCRPTCHSSCKTHFCYMLTGTVERVTDDAVALRIVGLTNDQGEVVHPELTGTLVSIFNDGDYVGKVGENVESKGHFLTADNAAVMLAPGGQHYLDAESNEVAADRVSVMLH